MKPTFWVVFNNDHALAVCYTEEQADRDVARRKLEAPKRDGNFPPSYFHWHEVRASQEPLVVLNEEQQDLLDAIAYTNGAECPRADLPLLQQLQRRGLVTIEGPRGPGRQWYRAELTPVAILHQTLKGAGNGVQT